MRFVQARAVAFGPLKDATLDFAPGLNVVYGPNEAGKSTWQAAIYAGLCGIKHGTGQTTQQKDFKDRFIPWSGNEWEVTLEVELNHGRRLRFRHNLHTKGGSATDQSTGKDLKNELIYQQSLDGSILLGMNRDLYRQVGCIRQADVMDILVDPGSISLHLQKVLSNSEKPAGAALKIIDEFLKERVGSDKAPTKPFMVALAARQACANALKDAQEAHGKYLEALAATNESTARHDTVKGEFNVVELHLAAWGLRDTEATLERMKQLAHESGNQAPPSIGDYDDLANRLAAALSTWEKRPTISSLDGATAEELQKKIDSLPPMPVGDTTAHETVLKAEARLAAQTEEFTKHQADQPPASPVGAPATGTSEEVFLLRLRASDLENGPNSATLPPQRASSARAALLVAGVALGALAVLVAIMGSLAVAAVVLVAGSGLVLTGAFVRPRQSDGRPTAEVFDRYAAAVAEAERRGLPPEPAALHARANEIDEQLRGQAPFELWTMRGAELRSALATAEHELLVALDARGSEPSDSIVDRLAAYLADCDARRRQAEFASQKPGLEAQLVQRQQIEETHNEEGKRLSAAEAELLAACRAIGGTADAPDTGVMEARAWQKALAQRKEDFARKAAAWTELLTLRRQKSETELETKVAELRDRIGDKVKANTPLPDRDNLQSQRQQLLEDELEANNDAVAARTTLAALEKATPSVGAAEEALVAATAEMKRLETLRATLEKTNQYLKRAQDKVQGDAAPKLAAFVGPRLAKVTRGRYSSVTVDPASMVVRVDAGGTFRAASLLSHGTAEQTYLLLRAALVEIMTQAGESIPLLLDDVTVQSDSERTVAIMELLLELANEQQIILFTQETDVLDWAHANLAGAQDKVIELATPAPGA